MSCIGQILYHPDCRRLLWTAPYFICNIIIEDDDEESDNDGSDDDESDDDESDDDESD